MNRLLIHELLTKLSVVTAKCFSGSPKIKMSTLSSRQGTLASNVVFPASPKPIPSVSVIRSAFSSVDLPEGLELDNLEVVVSAVKSFQFGTGRRTVAISMYLVGSEGEVFVLEFTVIPFSGYLYAEAFQQ